MVDSSPLKESRSHSRQSPGSTSYDSRATRSTTRPLTGRGVVGAGSGGVARLVRSGPGPPSASRSPDPPPGRPTTAISTTTAAASSPSSTPRRGAGRPAVAESSTSPPTGPAGPGGSGGASKGARSRVTGVQERPSHQRSSARFPDGSSYQPGGR